MINVGSNKIFAGLLVAVVAFIVYANSLGNGFTLDDASVIVYNPIFKGTALSLFHKIDTISDTQLLPFYRPFTYLSFFVERQLHGFNPFFVRLFNVLLHSINAFLVYRLARTLFKDNVYAALCVGLLFAVHPLQTEGVDFNAGGRNTMLACFFAVSSYLVHYSSICQGKMYASVAGAVLFLGGLFSKETALMILPCIVMLEYSSLRTKPTGGWIQASIRLAPYLAATGFYLYMRWATLSKLGIQTSFLPGVGTKLLENRYVVENLVTRLLNNIYIIPRYLLEVIYPVALEPQYEIPEDLNLLALPLVVAWLCIFAALTWLFTKGRSRVTLFGLAWILLFWLPVSGIAIIPIPMADRYLYIPAIGGWIVVADQLFRFLPLDTPTQRRYVIVAVLSVLLLLAAVTMRRNLDWESDIALFSRFVDQFPGNKYAHRGLGGAYYKIGEYQYIILAEQEFEKSLALNPMFRDVHRKLANIKLDKGDLQSALSHYNEAIAMYPYDKEAHINRAITYDKLGMKQEAKAEYLFFLTSPGDYSNPTARELAEKRLRELEK